MRERSKGAKSSRSRVALWTMSTIAVAVIGAGALSAALQPSAPVSKGRRAGRAATASASHAKPRTGEATQREAPVMLAQALKTARDVEPIEADAASKAKQVEETPMPAGAYTISIDPRTIPPSQPDNPLGGSSFSSAQGIVPEQEPNDTPATATPLGGTNAVARGNIYKLGNPPTPAVGDLDYWSFVGAAGDKVYAATMTQWAPSSSTDTTLELFASDGTTIIETDLDDGSLSATSSSIAGATLPAAGTYYLRVRQASNSSRIAPYFLHFRLQSGAPTPETESNDTVATANALPANGWVSGTHGTATDADFYFFNANAGDTIFLSLDADPERDNVQWNPRVGIGLFGDATSLILVVDDASVGSATNPLSEAHFVTVKTTGTYYAYVDTTAQTSGGPTQTYTMSVSIHPATQIGTNCTVYTSADVPKTIGPGATTVDSTITVPGAPRIEDVNVSVTLNHALMADIDAAIVTPAGNENSLFTDIGATATGGQTQLDADFDDEAGIPPVFTALKGAGWQPEVSYRLAWLKGENAGGIWTLRLRDDLANTSGGSLTAWSITVCEPPAPTACAGVPVTVFQTDFEASASGFTHSGTGDQWARGLPTAAPITTCNSGTSCFKTNLAGTYAASSNQDLFSPNISLSGLGAPIRVSWAQRYQIESASFDEYYVDIREPGPTNSKVLFQWLDATMTDSVGSPATTINETAGWGVVTANADAYANKPAVQLHWNLAPDSSVNLAGVAIDDVTVTACCTAASCNDNNPCTDDLCDAALGCVHTNNTASCSDGNPCTGPDVCSGGVCVAGPNPCNDGNPCTNDICDGAGGCTYTTVNCDDANPCTDDSCTPASGCVHANNAAPCSDGNVCTLGDVCSGGSCVPGPLPARVAFCSNSPITIPAGAPTTTSGISSPYPASISVSTGPIVCSVTVDLQNVTHTFIADVDVLLAAPAGQNAIVMSDVGGTTAVAGVNLTLDDAAANSLPGGTIVSGTYKPTNITAGDTFAAPAPAPLGGSALSVFNATNPNGTWNLWVVDDATGDVGSINSWCVNIAAICAADTDCNDGNPCTDDSCSGGACVHTNNTAPCNDNNACTSNDTCSGGVCVGGPPPSCDDGDACTTDSCNPATGLCEHALVVCNDNNPCTDDTCVSPGGCVFTNNNANACSDNNGCTQTDACVDGTCVGSNPVNCDDGNVCTDDSCTPATGACVHAPNTNACDDGNACTTGDACGPTTSTNTSENFDGVTAPALPAGWTTSQTGTGSLWTTVSTSSDTAPNSAFGADGATVSDEVLVSPPVAITSPVSTATFRARWSFETSSGNCYDSSVLEISFNGGPFADIVTAGGSFAGGGYSGTTNAGFSNPLAGRAAWCFASTGYPNYLTVTVNLPASAAGQSIQLRWRVGTDSSTSATGYNIDTLVITETFQQCQPGTPVNCDDGNACTNDSCDPFAGCVHAAINCGDNDPCTNDSCDPQTGCVNTPITAPPEVNGIAVASDKTTFSWGGALYATAYDVVRGELSGLPVGPGGGDEICFDDLAGTSLNDASVPAVGGSYWYLARGENSCGLGTWGNATAGPRVTTTCP